MKQLIVTILIGIPGSGKSTWAHDFIRKNQNWIIVNRDSIRFMVAGRYVLEPKGENLVTAIQNETILSALDMKYNVIVDNTNLRADYIEAIIELVEYKADVEFLYLDCSLQKAIDRDASRERNVGEKIIKRMYNDLKILLDSYDISTKRKQITKFQHTLELQDQQVLKPNLPNCVIFDIDGTLALMGKRIAYDWDKVDVDFINPIVVETLKMWKQSNPDYKIILLSGRDSAARTLTIEWLNFNQIYFDELFMRRANDFRKDSIVKLELYENNIKDKYNVLVIYDDRNQVVDMWRANNLVCHQVNEGRF